MKKTIENKGWTFFIPPSFKGLIDHSRKFNKTTHINWREIPDPPAQNRPSETRMGHVCRRGPTSGPHGGSGMGRRRFRCRQPCNWLMRSHGPRQTRALPKDGWWVFRTNDDGLCGHRSNVVCRLGWFGFGVVLVECLMGFVDVEVFRMLMFCVEIYWKPIFLSKKIEDHSHIYCQYNKRLS